MKVGVLEGVFDEFGYNFVEDGAVGFEARVGIDFDEVDLVVGIDHEIESEYFEVIDSAIRIDVHGRSVDHVGGYFLHPGVDHAFEIEGGILLLQKGVQFLVADLVGLLVFAVVR